MSIRCTVTTREIYSNEPRRRTGVGRLALRDGEVEHQGGTIRKLSWVAERSHFCRY